MQKTHPATWSEKDLLDACKITFSRASGPGGQNRNKVETSVELEFANSGIHAHASERRTQIENRKVALMRLRCKLAVAYEMNPADASATLASNEREPSELWLRYCQKGLVNISENNDEWPSLLAELMSALRAVDWDLAQAAERLQTSSSQLFKTLRKYPPAALRLNEERKKRGKKELS